MDTAVALVESYLRLNGYFTVTEYQIQHPAARQPGRFETATDLDILAVRFPWAAETVLRHPDRPGEQRCEILLAGDPAISPAQDKPDLIIGEVKEGLAEFNRKLQTPEVLYAALRRTGCCPEEHIRDAAEALLHGGEFVQPPDHGIGCRIRLAAFCGRIDATGPPAQLAITLDHILRFIQERLAEYRPVLMSARFGDPTLSLLKLMDKMHVGPRSIPAEVSLVTKDPVCGMDVDEKTTAGTSVYKGKKYYFCSAGCKAAFGEEPDKYVR